MGAGLLEPVGHQIGAPRHPSQISFTQDIHVAIAQLPAHDAAAQKRRIAHNDIRLGPFGFRAIGVQQSIPMFDAIQRLQDGVGGVRVAVAPAPLNVADPDGDAGQFGGVVVDFQAEDIMRAGLQHDLGLLDAEVTGFNTDPFFDVTQGLECQIKEVAGAAGRVKHTELVQAQQVALIGFVRLPVRLGFHALADPGLNDGLGGVPLAQ